MQLDDADPLYDEKCVMWSRDQSIPQQRLRVSVCDNDNFKYLFALLRVIVADGKDLSDIKLSNNFQHRSLTLRDVQYPQNMKNEIRALKLLVTVCNDYLSRYHHTYEEDCAKLASNELAPFSNARHAVIQLKGEKEVLLFLKDFATTGLELLQVRGETAYGVAMATIKSTKHKLIARYCQTVVSTLRHDEQRMLEQMQRNVDMSKPTIV